MKVHELIATLNTMDAEAEVLVASDSEGNNKYRVDEVTSAFILEDGLPAWGDVEAYGELDVDDPAREWAPSGIIIWPRR